LRISVALGCSAHDSAPSTQCRSHRDTSVVAVTPVDVNRLATLGSPSASRRCRMRRRSRRSATASGSPRSPTRVRAQDRGEAAAALTKCVIKLPHWSPLTAQNRAISATTAHDRQGDTPHLTSSRGVRGPPPIARLQPAGSAVPGRGSALQRVEHRRRDEPPHTDRAGEGGDSGGEHRRPGRSNTGGPESSQVIMGELLRWSAGSRRTKWGHDPLQASGQVGDGW
jgi:hypothetical protein